MLPFFGIGMKTDLFQSCGHCLVFQICWHIECSTLTASSTSYSQMCLEQTRTKMPKQTSANFINLPPFVSQCWICFQSCSWWVWEAACASEKEPPWEVRMHAGWGFPLPHFTAPRHLCYLAGFRGEILCPIPHHQGLRGWGWTKA